MMNQEIVYIFETEEKAATFCNALLPDELPVKQIGNAVFSSESLDIFAVSIECLPIWDNESDRAAIISGLWEVPH